jgi:hypothetical protein
MESLPDIYVCLAVDHDKQTIIVLGFELADKDRANAKAQERAQEHFGHENAVIPIAIQHIPACASCQANAPAHFTVNLTSGDDTPRFVIALGR